MADTAFYETSAQVIPVLVLAAAIETQWLTNLRPLDDGPTSKFDAWVDATLLPLAALLLFAGEIAALHTIFTTHPTWLQERLVALALLAGGVGVFTPILNTITQTAIADLVPYGKERHARRIGMWSIRIMQGAVILLSALVVIFGVH